MAEEYEVDYSDKRFTEVETEKSNALKESEKLYDQVIKDSDRYYNQQSDAIKNYGDTQTKLQNEKTDFAIEQINQQKEFARKDYLKEQSGAYVDWQKQSNRYGAESERQASVGVNNSGYGESSQVALFNQYQNRVMAAREAFTRAVINYDNAIKDAQLQNNSLLAEIAFNTLMQSSELALQGMQYKNNLLLAKADRKLQLEQFYYQQRQDVLSQINQEMSMAEQIRQFNEQLAEQQRQFDEQMASYGSSGSGGGYSYSSGGYSSGGSYYYDDEDGGYQMGSSSKLDSMSEDQRNRLYQSVGMNRTDTGRVTAIEKLYNEGVITEKDVETMRNNYNI